MIIYLYNIGRLNIKFMVQKRQWRKDHPDAHYGSALFRYLREFSVMFRDYTVLACLDDKHRIKIGEPSFPVAAAERGRRVIVAVGTTFEVGDHDFTKFSIVPSVVLINDIPHEVEDSWYCGRVIVTLKEASFEPSTPLRHVTELRKILTSRDDIIKPILCIYSDGGPDHRVTYLSVKVSLILLFRALDLDYLLAVQTAPYNSWRNPVERVMATLNIGLQSVGLMRKAGDDAFERLAAACNSLKDLRKAAEKVPQFRNDVIDSVAPVKVLLSQIFQRLQFKGKKVEVSEAATQSDIDSLWQFFLTFETTCPHPEEMKGKSCLQKLPSLARFISHCCREHHYFFEIKKCGITSCDICTAIRLPIEVFQQIKAFPDPEPGEDNHYKPFSQVYGTATSEKFRPSIKQGRKKTLPFHGKLQHVRNVDMMLECGECGMWRLIYAKRKLTVQERKSLEGILDGMIFSCGSMLQDLDLPDQLSDVVFVRQLCCHDPVEILYYTAKYEPICIYCGQSQPFKSDKEYPQCLDCKDKPAIFKKT